MYLLYYGTLCVFWGLMVVDKLLFPHIQTFMVSYKASFSAEVLVLEKKKKNSSPPSSTTVTCIVSNCKWNINSSQGKYFAFEYF